MSVSFSEPLTSVHIKDLVRVLVIKDHTRDFDSIFDSTSAFTSAVSNSFTSHYL